MKKGLSSLLVLAFALGCLPAAPAFPQTDQDKPPHPDAPAIHRDSCALEWVEHDWDFALGAHGFERQPCDGAGGAQVWAWGPATVAGAPANVWGTVLAGSYPNNAGDGLLSPPFTVTRNADLMEIWHYVHMENNYDGGNVTVGGQVIDPVDGYTHPVISSSVSYYAYCVDAEPGYSGNSASGPAQEWVSQCFDLSAFLGQQIRVRFDFGSDSSVSYPGWYLGYVRIGSDEPRVPNAEGSWGWIKSTYR